MSTTTTCQWFVRCTNPATTTIPHPAKPQGVPCCQRCKDKYDRLSGPRGDA